MKAGIGVNTNKCKDCSVGDFVHVAVGAHLCGTVTVGKRTWIGAGATVSNNVNICDDIIIGAGAVDIKDIEQDGTYLGVPARMADENMEKTLNNKALRSNSGGGIT